MTVTRRTSSRSWSAAPGTPRWRWTSSPRRSLWRSRAAVASAAVERRSSSGRGCMASPAISLADHFRGDGAQRRALARLGIERRPLTDIEYERIEDLAGSRELRERVAEMLEALPPDQREAVRLRVVEEQGYETLSRALQISQDTARARVSRGTAGSSRRDRCGKRRELTPEERRPCLRTAVRAATDPQGARDELIAAARRREADRGAASGLRSWLSRRINAAVMAVAFVLAGRSDRGGRHRRAERQPGEATGPGDPKRGHRRPRPRRVAAAGAACSRPTGRVAVGHATRAHDPGERSACRSGASRTVSSASSASTAHSTTTGAFIRLPRRPPRKQRQRRRQLQPRRADQGRRVGGRDRSAAPTGRGNAASGRQPRICDRSHGGCWDHTRSASPITPPQACGPGRWRPGPAHT